MALEHDHSLRVTIGPHRADGTDGEPAGDDVKAAASFQAPMDLPVPPVGCRC